MRIFIYMFLRDNQFFPGLKIDILTLILKTGYWKYKSASERRRRRRSCKASERQSCEASGRQSCESSCELISFISKCTPFL